MTIYNPGPGFMPGRTYVGHGPATDYAVAPGAGAPQIYSAGKGTIHYVGTGDGYGNTVIIYHGTDASGNHIYTAYAHMQELSNLQPGQEVGYNQPIGEAGSTGRSSGPHLHFEVLSIPDDAHRRGIKPNAGTGTNTGLGGAVVQYKDPNPGIFDGYPAGSQSPPMEPFTPPGVPIGSDDLWEREGWNDPFDDAQGSGPPPSNCPLILDLDGDGIETMSYANGAYFDFGGDGFAESTGWVLPDDGLLVWDRNGDGVINDGSELFGNRTLLNDGTRAANGFQALAELDSNSDGVVDSSDSEWANLKIWQDTYADGFSDPNELIGLSAAGVLSIDVNFTTSNYVDSHGNEHRQVGSYTRLDGSRENTTDVWFQGNPLDGLAQEWLSVPTNIAALPDVSGSGNVYSLHQAMVRDATGTLQLLVQDFVTQADIAVRNATLEQILLVWTESQAVDPNSRGSNIDARKLAILEKFHGAGFVGSNGPDPHVNAAALLNVAYARLFEMVNARLLFQTHLKDSFDLASYSWNELTQKFDGDFSAVGTDLANRLTSDPVYGEVYVTEFVRTLKALNAGVSVDLDDLRASDQISWLIDSYGMTKIEGMNGDDSISGTNQAEAMHGHEGSDAITSADGDDVVFGGAGNDVLNGGWGSDILDGGDDNDLLEGGRDADILRGGAGNDILYGYLASPPGGLPDDGSGNDLEGGTGSDMLLGSAWQETYRFNMGDGYDVISDNGYYRWIAGGIENPIIDRILLGSGITPADVTVTRDSADLLINFANGSDQIRVQNWYIPDLYNGNWRDNRIEQLVFNDGTIWDVNILHAMGLDIHGTGGDDILTGLEGYADQLYGETGNDTLSGNGGADQLYGGSGNDHLKGDWGNDALEGGDDDDLLEGGYDADTLRGGAGDDILYGYLASPPGGLPDDGSGNDLEGGAGADTLIGSAWADTYRFNAGDGSDVITDNGYFRWMANYVYYPISDRILFGPGIIPDDVIVSRDNGDLLVNLANGADQIRIQNWYISDPYNGDWRDYRIEELVFDDATIWDVNTLHNMGLEVYGTADDDTLIGLDNYADQLYGEAGNDALVGNGGADQLYGGSGNDILHGGNGADLLEGGDGNDTLSGGGDTDTLRGGAGDDVLYSNTGDTSYEWPGNNVLEGGIGNDALIGIDYKDIFVFNLGDGQDTITDWGRILSNGGGSDRIVLGADIETGDVDIARQDSNLVINFSNSGDQLTINNWYLVSDPWYGFDYRIEELLFNDGTIWDVNTLHAMGLEVHGTVGDDTLVGLNNQNDKLYGEAGNDTLTGDDGADQLYGGTGNDALNGGLGNDTLEGGDGDDSLDGGSGSDVLIGGVGNDLLGGPYQGADYESVTSFGVDYLGNTYEGGIGNDSLLGSRWADIYRFNLGDGQDAINDYYGSYRWMYNGVESAIDDRILLGPGISFADISVARENSDLLINVVNGTDQIRVVGWYGGGDAWADNRIERLVFDDGTVLAAAQIEALVNYPPVLSNPVSDQVVAEDDVWNFVLPANTFSDPDPSDTLAYAATRGDGATLPGWLSFDASTKTFSGTPTNGDVGSYDIRITATDSKGASVSDVFIVSVSNLNDAPTVINSLADQNVQEGAAFSYVVPAGSFADPDVGDNLVYSASLSNGSPLPGWLMFDASTLTFSGTPANGQDGLYDVRVTAVDTAGVLASDVFRITVANNLSNTFTGTASAETINGTVGADILQGLGGSDTLNGNAGNDTLDGGSGNDTMRGGAGDDTYIVNATADVVTENANEGMDTVQSSVTYALGTEVENLALTGNTGINGTGNGSNNLLTGNSANNTLTGGAGNDTLNGLGGNDTLRGGIGDDIYIVGTGGTDTLTENANEGNDTVQSSITHTLGTNFENLTLTGTTAINGTGNSLGNTLVGNGAANTLTGNGGTDVLQGLGGNDALNGGAGNDTYLFGLGDGQDTITDSDATAGNTDIAWLWTDALNTVFAQSGNNLVITRHGGTEQVAITNWFSSASNHIEQIKSTDGSTLLDTQVANLIQAMATFSAQNGGISWDQAIDQQQADVQTIIAAHWQAS